MYQFLILELLCSEYPSYRYPTQVLLRLHRPHIQSHTEGVPSTVDPALYCFWLFAMSPETPYFCTGSALMAIMPTMAHPGEKQVVFLVGWTLYEYRSQIPLYLHGCTTCAMAKVLLS